jgi:glycosyltransferase involved in cell wall biosynthesis
MSSSPQQALFIGSVWPEPASSAGGSRTVQLMELFISQGWKLTFASTAADSEHAIDFSKWPVSKVSIQLNDSRFDDFISELQPTIVVFDKFMIEEQFGWRVAQQCPQALRILDTIDLHCLRVARQKALKEQRRFERTDLLKEEMAKRELASILRSDISLIISDVEMELLLELFRVDEALLHYVPFLLEPISVEKKNNWPAFESREHFITIGNFLHEPNWNAVLYLKQEIWPLIRKALPGADLHVYGAYTSQKAEALHAPKEGFFIKGRAVDAMEVVSKAKICLAPLRFGAGIKGKLVEAMQCGTPSVTTGIGAEGMHGTFNWNGSIANETNAFAKAAVQLYTDKALWENSREQGVVIINEFYAKKTLGDKLLKRILDVQQSLEEHRLKNFTGALLMHHTLASTKYLSKWIEEKNRKL